MSLEDFEKQLKEEGFKIIYLHQDGPNVFYPDHIHKKATAHIILEGEMMLIVKGEIKTVKAGDRFDILAGAMHSAKMGPVGCKYLIGEK